LTITAEVGDGLDPETLRSLAGWLSRARELRGEQRPEFVTRPAPERMFVLELINLVLSNGIALGGLATAVANWRKAHAGQPGVRVTVNDRVVIIIEGTEDEVRELREALGPSGEDDPGQAGPDE
jgi:hypothetical protein